MTIALFDLDGTVSRRDTLTAFVLRYLMRRPRRIVRLAALLPALLAFAIGRSDRGALKSALIRSAFGGESRHAVEAWTDAYVTALLPRGLHRDAIGAIERHRLAGDRLVLLSASPDLYVPEIARRLGFAECICTEVAWRGDRLDGALLTANRRGDEKLRCLEALRARPGGERIVAYGNAQSDLAHLARCDEAFLVNGSATARAQARLSGVRCVHWH